jgi:hypothetical protein
VVDDKGVYHILQFATEMLGKHNIGGVGLYVNIGTIGYFKNLKVTKGQLKKKKSIDEKVDGI